MKVVILFVLLGAFTLAAAAETLTWQQLDNRAQALYRAGRYDAAAATMRQSAALAEKQYGLDDINVARRLSNLALILKAQQHYSEGEALYGRGADADRLMRRSFASVAAPARAQGLVPAPADIFSDAQKSAAVTIDLARRRTEALADICISHSKDNEFRFALHLWQIENLEVTLPADRVLATIPAAQRKALESNLDHGKTPNAEPNEALCGLVSRSMFKQQMDYSQTDADAAKVLRAIYAAEDSMRIAKRDADLGAGCMKQHYNAGKRDFGPIRTLCECQTNAIKANATDAQIDAWLSELDAQTGGKPVTEQAPEVARAAGTTLHHDWIAKALADAAARCTAAH